MQLRRPRPVRQVTTILPGDDPIAADACDAALAAEAPATFGDLLYAITLVAACFACVALFF